MKINNVPDRIFLQISDEDIDDEIDFYSLFDVTWAEDKALTHTIEYVNVSVYNALLEKCKKERKNLRKATKGWITEKELDDMINGKGRK